MAQNVNENRKVIAGWDFPKFRANFGTVKRPKYSNKETGEIFTKLAFEKENGTYCFVSWSSKLPELTNEELKAQAKDLRVVQLEVSEEETRRRKTEGLQLETYKICRKGDFEEWETVDI